MRSKYKKERMEDNSKLFLCIEKHIIFFWCNTMYNFLRKSRCWSSSRCTSCIFFRRWFTHLILHSLSHHLLYVQHEKYNELISFTDDKWCSDFCCWFKSCFVASTMRHGRIIQLWGVKLMTFLIT